MVGNKHIKHFPWRGHIILLRGNRENKIELT